MKIAELRDKTILILGLGQEGRSSLQYLRAAFPEKPLGVADQLPLEKLPPEVQTLLREDSRVQAHLGLGYMASLAAYDVIVKTPGFPVIHPDYQRAVKAGKIITSQTAIFFANFTGMIVGITGTKGKSTTASLIHAILTRAFSDTQLLGNIGKPALDLLPQLHSDSIVVYELSSHQLEGLRQSPHIAVLLNIVPEHLDYYASFDEYVAAKVNITRFQTDEDFLVYDADHDIPRRISLGSPARKIPCSVERPLPSGCFPYNEWICYRMGWHEQEDVVEQYKIRLPGAFNLANVVPAVAVGKLLGVPTKEIADAVHSFKPLEHRLELVGTYDGVTYYNDSIATVPEAAIAALDALTGQVETVLLGGYDRGLDFSGLAKKLLWSEVKTLILFPTTGARIWKAVCDVDAAAASSLRHFFVDSMEEAVRLAKQHTSPGMACLLSPASPSFGLFRDYRERGERFKQLVRESEPRA
jgi:UDP-N-acetylmuramoylalanine--D-glutamate ligase